MGKKVVCVIPARLESTRLPRKILAKIGDKTMIQHVWEAAVRCPQFDGVYIAIDSEEVADEIDRFGGRWLMTKKSHENGTQRLIEFMHTSGVKADVWVNWQGDQPFVQSEIIDDLLQGVDKGMIWTLKKEIHDPADILAPQIVKVVTDHSGKALYFSRSPIPYDRTGYKPRYYKHIGLYAYSTEALKKIETFPLSPLCLTESLEQLTFLENGLPIQVYETEYETVGIDTPQDLQKACAFVV